MDRQILNFTANEQILVCENPIKSSTNKVNYIEAHFDLGQNWSGYDSVRAVWFNDFQCISTVLDSQGVTFVPFEVMKRNGKVKVNLVGSISEDDVLTDRLTSYPVVAVIVDCTAMVNGAETNPITPSQFEQYVAIVQALVGTVRDIDHIELNDDYTLTIYYSDGTSDTTSSIRGATGNGIASITKTGSSGSNPVIDTYTVTYTDGNTFTFTVTNGAKGDTGNGITSIEKTSTVGLVDTYTITYTNGNTTTFTVTNGEKGDKGDTGEVSQAQLDAAVTDLKSDINSAFPTDTATGDIASFADGADDIPMASVLAHIEPKQSGSGTPSPTNVRPISGRTEVVTQRTGANLIPYPYDGNIVSQNGVTVTVNNDGTIVLNGTATAITYLWLVDRTADIPSWVKPSTEYVISGGNGSFNSSGRVQMILYGSPSWTLTENKGTTPADLSAYTGFAVVMQIANGATYSNTKIYPQIELGSTATDYEPYQGDTYTTSLGQTVYGGTLDVVSGELVVDRAIVDMGTLNWGGIALGTESARFLTHSVKDIIKFAPSNYQPSPYIISSQYQVYSVSQGLSVDASIAEYATGELYVRDARYNDVTSFTTAMNGVQLVYELATPQTIQLTPQEVKSLLGYNNVWADTGSVEVTYRADVGLYVEKERAKCDEMIAPTEATNIASRNYTTGSLLIMGNTLYKVTANIANGGTITPNTNVTATTLADVISALA